MTRTVYLDYAATAALRPEAVVEAVSSFLRELGATPGRGAHRPALAAGRLALRCRSALAELLGVEGDPGRIAFQFNATHALNTAIQGLLGPGDAVLRTGYDHNAVRRPVAALARSGVQERVITARADGGVDLAEVEALLAAAPRARLVVVPHVSNVLGTALPVREIAERAHAAGALVLVDAAQSLGHLAVDVRAMGADLVAFTGHKGLLGPQGTGGLWVREGVDVRPLLRGGTGGDSLDDDMPAVYPDHLEAGTQNAPGIAGLLAGVKWLLERGIAAVEDRERALKAELLRRLGSTPGIQIRSPAVEGGTGIVTVTSPARSPEDLALRLERDHRVLVRAGLHCAPEAHRALGTLATGAVRLSIGWATTPDDIEHAARALGAAAGE